MGLLKDLKEYLDSIDDEKLTNFSSKEYSIDTDYDWGLRVDHQGVRRLPLPLLY